METIEKSPVMKTSTASIRLSASDLSNHLACRHLTILDLTSRLVDGRCPPGIRLMRKSCERGIAHEDAYVEHLRSSGLAIVSFRGLVNDDQAVTETPGNAIWDRHHRSGRILRWRLVWTGRCVAQSRPAACRCMSTSPMTASSHMKRRLLRFFSCLSTALGGAVQGLLPDVMYVVHQAKPIGPNHTGCWIMLLLPICEVAASCRGQRKRQRD